MVIWTLQIVFDLMVFALVVYFLAQRRKFLELQSQMARMEFEMKRGLAPTPSVLTSAPAQPSALLPSTSLNEKKPVEEAKPKDVFEAYETAEGLIAKGIDIKEIAKKTGLSLSELQLMGKFTQRNQ